MKSIGYLGLGVMGCGMTSNLIAKIGGPIMGYDPVPEQRSRFAKLGGQPVDNPTDLYRSCDLIMMCLPTYDIVKKAIEEIIETAPPDTIIVDLGSTSPYIIRDLHKKAADKGIYLIDAPVSGGQIGAENGTLAIMVGGEENILEEIRPYLQMMGSSVTYMGPSGCGSTAKLANNMISGIALAAIGEAFAFAKKAGIDSRTLYNAIKGGFAQSTALDMRAERILTHNFFPASGRAEIQLKDANGALEMAERMGVQLPLTQIIAQNLTWMTENGFSAEDHSAMVRYYESHMDVQLNESIC